MISDNPIQSSTNLITGQLSILLIGLSANNTNTVEAEKYFQQLERSDTAPYCHFLNVGDG